MVTTPPLLSPIIWTTIATGRTPDEHGVLDFMVDLPSGGQGPVSVASRRVPALWTIASAQGRRVGVVGWWATWPAERLDGIVVSDRVAPQVIRPDRALTADTIAPPDQARALAPAIVSAGDVSRDDLSVYAPVSAEQHAAALRSLDDPKGGLFYRDRVAHLAASIASSRTYAAMAERILRGGQPDVVAVYDEGVDAVSHLFVRDVHGAQAIEAAYREADALLARLAAAAAPDTWVIVCSDHGFQGADAGITEDPGDLAG